MSVLRPLDPEHDGPALHAVFGDEESCRYLPAPLCKTVAETIARLQGWTTGFEDTSWAIVDAPGADALGRVTLFRPGEDAQVWEIGVMIVPAAQGRGLAAAAVQEAVDYGFRVKQARRIVADIDPDNVPSIRLFEKQGFQLEGRLRAAVKTHIGVRDSVIYSLINSDQRPAP
jgi:RimJ/RimL family protein N-acetyltransferase